MSDSQTVKAAIFDVDGTMVDSMYVWEKVDCDFLTQRGIPVTSEYSETMRGMFFEQAAQYTIDHYGLNESVEQIVSIWLDMARHEYENNVKAKPQLREYLDELKSKGIRLGIATSSDPYLLEPVLSSNHLNSYFDKICYTSQVGRGKSFPDIYLYTARQLGVHPQNCVVFEDIPEGISGANKAGMKTVAVYDKASQQHEQTLKQQAHKYIFGFSEVLGEDLWKETDLPIFSSASSSQP